MCEYLRTKFQVSSVILTSLRQGVILPPHLKMNPLKSPPRLGLKKILGQTRVRFDELLTILKK